MDFDGNLAAATSTGGLLGNEVGRIGDTPSAGMGVFADNDLGFYNVYPCYYCTYYDRNTYLELNSISKRFKFISGAVSTTGIGECLMRSLCANEIALCMGRQKLMPNAAIKTAMDNMTQSIGGDGKY